MKYYQGNDIPKPKIYRLIYVDETVGRNVKFYSTNLMLLKEKLTQVKEEAKKTNKSNAKFWIIQEQVSNTEKPIWNEIWFTIERTPEIDQLFAPEPMTEIERHYEERL